MKAAYLESPSSWEKLVIGDLPQPSLEPGQVLIKVHAATVMPSELEWYPTFHQKDGAPRPFPIILGHEFSGVIAEVGAKVGLLRAGDAVYGLNDWFSNGAQAEYCVAGAEMVALKPQSVDHNHAAVTPISALTAWQGLFDKGGLAQGQRILIHGSSGGVGTFAVQLARWAGAHVIGSAAPRNFEFVRELGAQEVVDYHTEDFAKVAPEVDLIFDGVGGETLARSWPCLKAGGKVVTVASPSTQDADPRAREAFMLVLANSAQLTKIAALIDEGTLRVLLAEKFPLDEARAAFARAAQGGLRGKVALQVAEE